MASHWRSLISRLPGLVVASALLAACNTQQPPTNQAQAHSVPTAAAAVCVPITSDAPADLQKKPGYQQLAVSVMDEAGREVQNLGKDDFVAKLADKPLPVEFTEYQLNGPISVLILADTSGSTEAKLPQTREAITQVVNNLDPRDDVALFAFSSKPFNLQSFTREHSAIIERETILHAYGSTSLYDGVHTSVTTLQRGCYARRVLVVISDGIDNTSGKSRNQATHDLKTGGVSAYAIAIGSSDATGNSGLHFGPFVMNQDADSVDEKSLGLLTNPAGGSTFKVREVGDGDLLAAAAKSILESSRGQYVVGFIDATKTNPAAVTIQVKNHEDYLVTMQKNALTATATQASRGVARVIAKNKAAITRTESWTWVMRDSGPRNRHTNNKYTATRIASATMVSPSTRARAIATRRAGTIITPS